ncbi:Transmembrane protein 62 [Physocladia obscura]|uniref:Transmembrane protein 62 n=1 Tax=Physocladia obscura TaxID=109957 RepID=A0AAD5T5T5_9FUNG|nr:Transmembrane protein 62 [Physocladia obscura]
MARNHDCFNVGVDFEHSEYGRMSATRRQGYIHDHIKSFGTYTFAALDACPAAGMSRPINFFGTLDITDMTSLASIVDNSTKNNHAHTFITTHYPTSTTVFATADDGRTLSDLTPHVSLWLNGHLHRLIGGLTMHAFHKRTKFLELELGDMKDNAMYRVVAIDNNLVSIVDTTLAIPNIPALVSADSYTVHAPDANATRAPLIIVTNPRDARYALGAGREPVGAILESSHIRILIYAFDSKRGAVDPANVTVVIDGRVYSADVGGIQFVGTTKPWSDVRAINETDNHVPLYVCAWEPKKWDDGKDHIMEVEAVDVDGTVGKVKIVFRVDGKRAKEYGMGSGLGGWIIAANFEALLKGLFLFAHLFIMALLLIPKIFVDYMIINGSYNAYRAAHTKRLDILNKLTFQPSLRTSFSASNLLDNMESGTPQNSPHMRFLSRRYEKNSLVVLHFERLVTLWTLRFMNFAGSFELYFPFYIYFHYLLVGPWFVGNLVPSAVNASDRVGLFYVYGIWFSGTAGWVPILDTWQIALWEHTSFVFPLILLLAYMAPPHPRVKPRFTPQTSSTTWLLSNLVNLVIKTVAQIAPGAFFTLWLLGTVYFGFFGWTYGWLSVFVSPGKMWMCGWVAWVVVGRKQQWNARKNVIGAEENEYGEDNEEYSRENVRSGNALLSAVNDGVNNGSVRRR